MRRFRIIPLSKTGFSLIEIILTIVVVAIVGVMFLSYMGISLSHSADPIHIARDEAMAETWMERITSDFVKEMNSPATYATALMTIKNRNYSVEPYNMPVDVTLTRTYITYDASGNEIISGGTTTNLKVIVQAGANTLTTVLAAERTSNGDPCVFY